MTNQPPRSDEFKHNAQAALQGGNFQQVLKALGMKLLELGVPGAETPDVADKVNHPLTMAYIQSETEEARDRAWGGISARIFHLSSLLPPEAADGAFLADRNQVEALLARNVEWWASTVFPKPETGGEGQERGQNTFKGLSPEDKSFWSGIYNGGHDPARPPGYPLPEGVADERPATNRGQSADDDE